MKQSAGIFKMADKAPVTWLLICLTLVTLYFQTNLADPFNSPKSWILIICSAWLLGYILTFKYIIFSNYELKHLCYFLCAFILALTLASIFTDFKYVALFGDTQRRNGFIVYFSLAIILLATSVFVRMFNIPRFFSTTKIIAISTVIYGTMQTTGNDFVPWVNPHNALIGTQGNPNFASAVMGIMGVLIFSQIFRINSNVYQKFFLVLLLFSLTILILRSNSRQGFFVLILGIGSFMIIWLFGKSKQIGMIALFLGIGLFFFTVLGMLQAGPLEKFVYKPSVSVRGFYWRAGIEMLKQNPFLGIGIDRYGAYFMQYRELDYPIRYGYEITSSNAHNTFIQFFATGGLPLGLSYTLLLLFILKQGIIGLRNLKGEHRTILAGVVSAWVGFQAQSLISIDNIGISIWGWVLGGAIIGLSLRNSLNQDEVKRGFLVKKNEINTKRIFFSSPILFGSILLVAILYRGENNSFKSAITFDQSSQESVNFYAEAQIRSINSKLIDPKYALINAQNLMGAGFLDEGIKSAEKIYENDPRNLDALNVLAIAYESKNMISKAIKFREELIKLNQWSAPTYLALAKNYKSQGDLQKCKDTLDKLLTFATGINSESIIEEANEVLKS